MHIYKYAQPHSSIFQQNVSVNTYFEINKNVVNIQTCVQKCMIKPLGVTLDLSVAFLIVKIYKIMLPLKCIKWGVFMLFVGRA
jgi:hypothetical protein